jgi:hypothetical protein
LIPREDIPKATPVRTPLIGHRFGLADRVVEVESAAIPDSKPVLREAWKEGGGRERARARGGGAEGEKLGVYNTREGGRAKILNAKVSERKRERERTRERDRQMEIERASEREKDEKLMLG